MHQPPAPFPVHYSVFTPADADEMAALLAEAFSTREPIGIAVRMHSSEFASFVHVLLSETVTQNLSIVARRTDTGEMVGALLTADAGADSEIELDKLGESFAMVASILGRLVETYGGHHHPAPGESLHLFLLGVSKGAEGMGIGHGLVAACMENGARLGYKSASAECTGKASQHIFRKLGYAERGMISYADHEYKGRRIFAAIADHGGPILMEKVLQP